MSKLTQRRVATDDDLDTIVDVAAGSRSKQKSRNGLDTFGRFRHAVFYHAFAQRFGTFTLACIILLRYVKNIHRSEAPRPTFRSGARSFGCGMWMTVNMLSINIDKTCYSIFGSKNKTIKEIILLVNNVTIKTVNCSK